MRADKAFFDTNILIYAFSDGDSRQSIALDLLLAGGTVGVQALNEFANVVTRKMKIPWTDALMWLDAIRKLCPPPVPLNMEIHHRGLQITQACGYHIYDSLMLAAALESSCTIFYSEDMHDGQIIDTLTIKNPFHRRPPSR